MNDDNSALQKFKYSPATDIIAKVNECLAGELNFFTVWERIYLKLINTE